MTGRDDEALSWEGDDDPSLESGRRDPSHPHAPGAALPHGFTAVGKGSHTVASGDARADAEAHPAVEAGADAKAQPAAEARPAAMGNAQLIVLGVLGGVHALYAVGWLIGGLRLQGWRPFLVTDAMYQGSLWLAVLAPLLWFGTVFLLTRGARPWMRFAWLGAGALLLVPWPFVLIGAVGQ